MFEEAERRGAAAELPVVVGQVAGGRSHDEFRLWRAPLPGSPLAFNETEFLLNCLRPGHGKLAVQSRMLWGPNAPTFEISNVLVPCDGKVLPPNIGLSHSEPPLRSH